MELTDLFDQMHVGELSLRIRELFPEMHLSPEEMLKALLQGRILELGKYLLSEGILGTWERMGEAKGMFVSLLLLGILSALVMQFSDLLERFGVANLSFYFSFLLQAAIACGCFAHVMEIAADALGNACGFIRLLMPTYLVAVTISTGGITAGASHQMTLLILSATEETLLGGFLPMIKGFFLLTILEGVQMQEQMELLLELIKKGVKWGLKGILGILGGISFLQAILTPALDKMSGSVAKKLISAIPGIGDGAEGVLEIVMGSAIVIKNGMGILLVLLLIYLCTAPLLEILTYSVMLKLAAAVTGIVSDKRLSKALDRAGEACLLLLGVAGVGMLLFLMTLAVTCTAVR